MKTVILILGMLMAWPAFAADKVEKTNDAPEEAQAEASPQDELSSQYYKIRLPKDWKILLAPKEEHGNLNAIFANKDETCVITIIMGPTLGAEPKNVAAMFAEQFKASKAPVLKNGEYTFSFKQRNSVAQASLSVENNIFRLVTVYGDQKIARNFLNNNFIPLESSQAAAEPAAPVAEKKPAEADAAPADPNAKTSGDSTAAEKADSPKTDQEEDKDKMAKAGDSDKTKAESAANENEFACKYYTVTLPAGWKAVMPPTDEQGNINAIFSNSSGTAVVTLIVGPSLGEDAANIASMFADQFRAKAEPVEKGGQYTFAFKQNGVSAQARLCVAGSEFMLTTTTGDTKLTRSFIENNIKSDEYQDLMPK